MRVYFSSTLEQTKKKQKKIEQKETEQQKHRSLQRKKIWWSIKSKEPLQLQFQWLEASEETYG